MDTVANCGHGVQDIDYLVLEFSFIVMGMPNLGGSGAKANFSHILHCQSTCLNSADMVEHQ